MSIFDRTLLAVVVGAMLFAAPAWAADRTDIIELYGDGPSYVPFNPISISVIDNNNVVKHVGVTLMIRLVNQSDKKHVEAKRLQLHDAFLRALYSFFAANAALHEGIDQKYLKSRLLRAADKVVGPHEVQEVLIEQLYEQPQ